MIKFKKNSVREDGNGRGIQPAVKPGIITFFFLVSSNRKKYFVQVFSSPKPRDNFVAWLSKAQGKEK